MHSIMHATYTYLGYVLASLYEGHLVRTSVRENERRSQTEHVPLSNHDTIKLSMRMHRGPFLFSPQITALQFQTER